MNSTLQKVVYKKKGSFEANMLRIDWCSFVVSFPLVEKKEIKTSMARIFNYFIVYNSNLFNSGLAFL